MNCGNIGIGTTTPTIKLHVEGTVLGTNFTTTNNASALFRMKGQNLDGSYVDLINPGGGHFRIKVNNANLDAIHIEPSGEVGINTVAPKSTPQVGSTAAGGSQYLQIDAEGSPPLASDCDEFDETGRVIFDYSFMRLWVCGGSSGWRYVSTTQ